MDAASLAGLLAEDGRRRVVAALVLGATTVEDVIAVTGLGTRVVVTALGRLVSGGLVVVQDEGQHALVLDAFREAARSSRTAPTADTRIAGGTEEEAKVLRAFVRDGQLISIPTSRSKRLVLLNLMAAMFEPGLRYEEWEVNALLRRWHPDSAALRRYLVDEDFLGRDHGEYWRTGGTVDTA
jgi:hypothetical protein